jgi:hypothetical protein
MHPPQQQPIEPRSLSTRERSWIHEILEHNSRWADVDINETHVIAQCDCGKCKTVFLDSASPQNPLLSGTKGWVGRIEIQTYDDFMITVALDQLDGKLSGLYVEALDLHEPGHRPFPKQWHEKEHIAVSM